MSNTDDEPDVSGASNPPKSGGVYPVLQGEPAQSTPAPDEEPEPEPGVSVPVCS